MDDASRAERLFDSEAMTEQRRAAEALWLELVACQAAVSACYPSAEQLREEAAEAERLAQRDSYVVLLLAVTCATSAEFHQSITPGCM